jgi:hypothetical protein
MSSWRIERDMNHFELTYGDDFVGRFLIGAAIAGFGAAVLSRLVATLRERLARAAPPHLEPGPTGADRVAGTEREGYRGEERPRFALAEHATIEAERSFRRRRRGHDIWTAVLAVMCALTVGFYASEARHRVTGVGEIASFGRCKSTDGRSYYPCFEATFLPQESGVGLELQSCPGFRYEPLAAPAERLALHDHVLLTLVPGDRRRCVLGPALPLSPMEGGLLLLGSFGLFFMCAVYQRGLRPRPL